MFSTKQIAALRAGYSKLDRIDPCSDQYRNMIDLLDALDQPMLGQLAKANIKFLSRLAANRVQDVGCSIANRLNSMSRAG